jgi:hypothetical protein
VIAAERPEARAGTTGEDQGVGMGKIGHARRLIDAVLFSKQF